jgi:AcrR family transcriptional regulator
MLPGVASTPRRRVPRAEREQQMLEAAVTVFTERGFDAASMDEIAERTGITKPMLFRYFGSKEGLYLASIERAAKPMIELFRVATVEEQDPARRLWAGTRAFLGWVDENRAVYARLFLEATARGGEPAALVERLSRELNLTLSGLFVDTASAAGVAPTAEVEAMAVCMNGATAAMARWWLEHPDVSRDLVALRLVNFAWMGLENLMTGRLWLPPPDAME